MLWWSNGTFKTIQVIRYIETKTAFIKNINMRLRCNYKEIFVFKLLAFIVTK
jgi:hypothetical protein